jgi:hypothetical protein
MPYVGQRFRMRVESTVLIDVELLAVSGPGACNTAPSGRRDPFSIVFRAATGRVLPQKIYRMEHEHLGTFDLFLVPIGPDSKGMRYEAVFG